MGRMRTIRIVSGAARCWEADMPGRLLLFAVSVLLLSLLAWTGSQPAAAAPSSALAAVTPPPGTEGFGANWYTVATPAGRTLVVAIYDTRSSPDQAVPAILVLHGSHGFASQYVQIAHDLSEQTGYVVAAGCWFDGAAPDTDTSDVTPIRCPGSPEFAGATQTAWPTVRALTEAVRQYAGGGPLGIFGHARGAEIALQLASTPDPSGAGIQAVVASSGIYASLPHTPEYDSPTPLSLADGLTAPVLILHGQADTQARFSNAALYYERLQKAGKSAQCVVYPRVGQDAMLRTASGDPQARVFTDGVRRSAAFFQETFSGFASAQAADCTPG
jgi:dienelactone hydrolase